MNVIEVFNDCEDQISPEENGAFNYSMFNRFSWLGQLRFLDWLSGDVAGVEPPEPYRTQKNRDWLSDFTTKYPQNVTDGIIVKPADYYRYDNLYLIQGSIEECEAEDSKLIPNIPISILSNDKFYTRVNSFIEGVKPTYKNPIAKMVGKNFEFYPLDIGSVGLEYIRYPKRAKIVVKKDEVFNVEVPDEPLCVDFEWGEYARELLVWFIVDRFTNRTREQAEKQFNVMTGKTVRDGK